MSLRALAQRFGLVAKEEGFIEDAEDPLWRAELHRDADAEVGGLACTDDRLLAEMREAIMVWVKSMGRQILAGNLNLVNTSFPVLMFEPRSYLQKLADPWVFNDYLNAAAAARDPLERMKLLVTWSVAGAHKGFETWKKPFNPILGETWQAASSDGGGVTLFMEQVSHHPPVSAYELVGPGGAWKLSGWSQPAVAPVVKFYGIKTLAKGRRRFELPDGTRIDFYMPHYAIKGVVYAARPRAEVLGVLRIVDAANGLEAVVAFGPVKGARHRVLARADAVCGEIYRLPGGGHAGAASPAPSGGRQTPEGGGAGGRHAGHGSGALQRSATEAQALSELEGGGSPRDAGELASGSEDGGSGGGGGGGGGDGPDAEDAAIFDAVESAGGLSGAAPLDSDPAAAKRASISGGGGIGSLLRGKSPVGGGGRVGQRLSGRRSATSGDLHGAAAAAGDLAGADGAEAATYHRNHGARVPGVAVARIEGSWLSHLNIDSTRYWTLAGSAPSHWVPLREASAGGASNGGGVAAAAAAAVEPPLKGGGGGGAHRPGGALPSDAEARRDLRALQRGDREAAQRLKEEMEVEQRADRKLREAAGVFEHH